MDSRKIHKKRQLQYQGPSPKSKCPEHPGAYVLGEKRLRQNVWGYSPCNSDVTNMKLLKLHMSVDLGTALGY